MNIIIVEDETLAAQMLQKLIMELEPRAEIVGKLQSIEETVEWLNTNPMPDMMFVDIHLADGSAFVIFQEVNVTCPVIFTTAYDEYALKAFEVNSIDYLLKPINKKELEHAFRKYENLTQSQATVSLSVDKLEAAVPKRYKSYFLVPNRDRLLPVAVKDIAYIYTGTKNVKITMFDKTTYVLNMNMEDVMSQLDPAMFFRANRQFIVAKEAIKDLTLWFGNRLSLNLKVDTPEDVLVSKARASDFKQWFMGGD